MRIEIVEAALDQVNASFLDRAQQLESQGRIDDALDVIYRDADRLMHAGEFSRLNDTLASLDVARFSIDLTLGVLTATLPAKRRLPERSRIFRDFERHLREIGEWDDQLLSGLQP